MALTIVTTNTEYYADSIIGKPVSLGSVFVGKPDLDPEVEANRLAVVVRQEDGTDVTISPSQQPLETGAGGIVQYQGANVQVLVEGNYSIKVLRQNNTQAYYVADVLSGIPVDRAETIIRYANIAALRATGGSTDMTVWIDGHTTFQDGGQGVFNFDSSSSVADDDGVTVELDSTTTGRYIRSIPQGFSVGFYGLKTDGSDMSAKFLAAVAAAGNKTIHIPGGTYSVLAGNFSTNKFSSLDSVVITTNITIFINYNQGFRGGEYVKLREFQTSGGNGGTPLVGANTRQLTISDDPLNLVTASAGRFTLAPGEWEIAGFASAYTAASHKLSLRNYTANPAAPVLIVSGSSELNTTGSNVQTRSTITHRFTIGKDQELIFSHFFQNAQNSVGLGFPVSTGDEEIYAEAILHRVRIGF